jgi:hypothetical protein
MVLETKKFKSMVVAPRSVLCCIIAWWKNGRTRGNIERRENRSILTL